MEKSTDGGHALVLGASPLAWRLDGEPATVVDDAEAQGGFVMAAHPPLQPAGAAAGRRAAPAWPACEIVNLADPGAWPSGLGALPALLHYPLDPRGALLARASSARASRSTGWDSCSAERPLAGWLGSDAHGGFPAGPLFVPIPSYRAILGLGSNHLLLPEPWNGDVAHDGALVWRALREGRGYAALDALADASRFRFEVRSGGGGAGPGGTLVLDGGTARLEAAATAPPGTTLVLVRNGQVVARGPRIDQDVGPGVFRVEAYLDQRFVPGGRALPWIVSNPIVVADAADARTQPSGHRSPAGDASRHHRRAGLRGRHSRRALADRPCPRRGHDVGRGRRSAALGLPSRATAAARTRRSRTTAHAISRPRRVSPSACARRSASASTCRSA